uniref:Uncharacterized protein n=1 Tax=Arundo donax TaxID=35708 RepID=A0A0A8ZH76_ARUDO
MHTLSIYVTTYLIFIRSYLSRLMMSFDLVMCHVYLLLQMNKKFASAMLRKEMWFAELGLIGRTLLNDILFAELRNKLFG